MTRVASLVQALPAEPVSRYALGRASQQDMLPTASHVRSRSTLAASLAFALALTGCCDGPSVAVDCIGDELRIFPVDDAGTPVPNDDVPATWASGRPNHQGTLPVDQPGGPCAKLAETLGSARSLEP